MKDIVGTTTRGLFRSLMTSCTLGEINSAFQDEGFAPNADSEYEDASVRRTRVQQYLESVDWRDMESVSRALRVIERLVEGFPSEETQGFWNSLRRDGFKYDQNAGYIVPIGPQFASDSLRDLKSSSAIREYLDRIQRAAVDDPALAVGSAKELIESTAKVVLVERGVNFEGRDDIQSLIRKSQQALELHPSSTVAGPDGKNSVRKILGGVTSIAIGVAELRNQGYGTGHGVAEPRLGLRQRHAHLAVNAALTWCQIMLDTLVDSEAPWRKMDSAKVSDN